MSDYKLIARKYRNSISDSEALDICSDPDIFSLGYQWKDKPQNHVFDLCRKLDEADDEIIHFRKRLADYKSLADELRNIVQQHQNLIIEMRNESKKICEELSQKKQDLCEQFYQTGYEDALEYASIRNIQKHIDKRKQDENN